jgi:hypothetical protein
MAPAATIAGAIIFIAPVIRPLYPPAQVIM